MHDPMTQVFHIDFPIGLTIWHVDPCSDGTDDSCGWFPRARHGDKTVLEQIVKRFDFDWDRTFTSDSNHTYCCGLFRPNGDPHLSVHAIVLNLFFIASTEVFGSYDKAVPFMKRNLFEILLFAENTSDSLFDGVTRKFEIGCEKKHDARARKERIRQMAGCVYAWILRKQRPWYRHPRWHFWHWKIQIYFWQKFYRWAFQRCCKCGGRFSRWGDTNVISNWDGDKIWHGECDHVGEPKQL